METWVAHSHGFYGYSSALLPVSCSSQVCSCGRTAVFLKNGRSVLLSSRASEIECNASWMAPYPAAQSSILASPMCAMTTRIYEIGRILLPKENVSLPPPGRLCRCSTLKDKDKSAVQSIESRFQNQPSNQTTEEERDGTWAGYR